MKCAIIRDLMPSYIDGLTNEESNREIEKHIESCEACRDYLAMLRREMSPEQSGESYEQTNKEILPFVKYKYGTAGGIITVVVAAIGILILLLNLLSWKTKLIVHEDYQGPNFSLTAVSDAEGIVAERTLLCDYSEYDYSANATRKVKMEDRYVLENTTEEDIVLEVAYGFAGDYGMRWENVPSMTVDGKPMNDRIVVGRTTRRYQKEDVWEFKDRQDFEALLEDGTYQKEAFEADENPPVFSEKVQVFRFMRVGYDGTIDYAEYPIARMFFEYDPEKTEVYTFGIDYEEQIEEVTSLGFSIPKRNMAGYKTKDVYLVAVGEKIELQDIKCYRDLHNQHELEELTEEFMDTATFVEYETTLEEVLDEIVSLHRDINWGYGFSGINLYDKLTKDQIFKAGKQHVSDMREVVYDLNYVPSLEDYLFRFIGNYRVFYRAAEITIPAKESVTVTLNYEKYLGLKKIRNEGYDGLEIMTTFGSNLKFRRQKLKVTGMEELSISEHTTGEALEQGQYEVELGEGCFEIYLEVPELKENRGE